MAAKRREVRTNGGRNRSTVARMGKGIAPHLVKLRDDLLDTIAKVRTSAIDPRAGEAIAKLSREVLEIERFSLETAQASAVAEQLAELQTALKEKAS